MTPEALPETTAKIRECSYVDSPSPDAASLFVGHFRVVYSYVVEGDEYTGEFGSSHDWEPGVELQIIYDPEDPAKSTVIEDDRSRAETAAEWTFGFLDGL